MEAFFGQLEARFGSIPMPERHVYILASRKLLGGVEEGALVERYADLLAAKYDGTTNRLEGQARALELCIDAYIEAMASRNQVILAG